MVKVILISDHSKTCQSKLSLNQFGSLQIFRVIIILIMDDKIYKNPHHKNNHLLPLCLSSCTASLFIPHWRHLRYRQYWHLHHHGDDDDDDEDDQDDDDYQDDEDDTFGTSPAGTCIRIIRGMTMMMKSPFRYQKWIS